MINKWYTKENPVSVWVPCQIRWLKHTSKLLNVFPNNTNIEIEDIQLWKDYHVSRVGLKEEMPPGVSSLFFNFFGSQAESFIGWYTSTCWGSHRRLWEQMVPSSRPPGETEGSVVRTDTGALNTQSDQVAWPQGQEPSTGKQGEEGCRWAPQVWVGSREAETCRPRHPQKCGGPGSWWDYRSSKPAVPASDLYHPTSERATEAQGPEPSHLGHTSLSGPSPCWTSWKADAHRVPGPRPPTKGLGGARDPEDINKYGPAGPRGSRPSPGWEGKPGLALPMGPPPPSVCLVSARGARIR